MTPDRRWRTERPSEAAWRAIPGLDRAAYAAEQDAAAGSRDNRRIRLDDGTTALASVALRQPARQRRIYAYLRWSQRGKTHERFLGEVTHTTRSANLAEAWRFVASG